MPKLDHDTGSRHEFFMKSAVTRKPLRMRRNADDDLWLKLEDKLAEREIPQHELARGTRKSGWLTAIFRGLGVRRDTIL